MKRSHAAHWSLNWAMYETLHGQGPKALSALQAALKTAEGNMHVCDPSEIHMQSFTCSPPPPPPLPAAMYPVVITNMFPWSLCFSCVACVSVDVIRQQCRACVA